MYPTVRPSVRSPIRPSARPSTRLSPTPVRPSRLNARDIHHLTVYVFVLDIYIVCG